MKRKSFTYNTIIMTLANTITRILGFAYRIFLSRFIGAEGLGLYGLIMPVYSVCSTIIASGLPVASMKLTSERLALGDKQGARSVISCTLKAVAIISFILFSIVILFSSTISSILGDERLRIPLVCLSFAILITGFENIYKSYFYAAQNVKTPSFAEIVEQILRICFVVTLLAIFCRGNLGLSVIVMTLGIFVGEAVSSIFLSLYYIGAVRTIKKPKDCTEISKRIYQCATPITLARVANSIIMSLTSVLIPTLLTLYGLDRSEALSLFGILTGMVVPILLLPCIFTNAISVNLVPFVSSNLAKNNYAAINRKLTKSLMIVSLVSYPAAAAMSALAEPLGIVLYSESRVGTMLPFMAIGSLICTFQHIFGSVLNASGGEKKSAVYSFSGNIISLLTSALLIPLFGIKGYIVAYTISSLAVLIPEINLTFKLIKCNIDIFSKPLFLMLPSILCFLLIKLFYKILAYNHTIYLALILSLALGLFVYIALIWLMGSFKKIIIFNKNNLTNLKI
ncbi:MAG: oligosaccharide flippase family protein [Bacillota bacterium]|nr:oligosaccharide flippase family protein [Bacillota bacterium]